MTCATALAFALLPAGAATVVPGDDQSSGAAVYYHAQDGKRYVFPNEKTYFTWYADLPESKRSRTRNFP